MNRTHSTDKAGPLKESNPPSATAHAHATTTNTTSNANAGFIHQAFSFGHPGSPLDPTVLLTPTAAAAVAAVAQQIAQAGAPISMTLSTQAGQGAQHLGLSNVQSDPNYQLGRQQSESTSDNNLSSSMVAALPQALPPHLTLLNTGLPFANNWTGINVSNKPVGQGSSQQTPFPATANVQQNAPSMIQANFQVMQNNAANMVAAAAHAAAAQAAISSAPMGDAMVTTMKSWKLEQLEEHVKLLQQLKQPVPQSVSVLLAESRRKEEKRSAKRVANRKSACTSRARKKALVEEMTKTNAKLRRQALILALLPDLVIAMTIEGVITFCSAQVERVLQHRIDDLVGANLADLLLPSSREALRKLVHHLVAVEQAASQGGELERGKKRRHVDQETNEARSIELENGNQSSGSGSGAELSSGAVAVVSDKSFPLSIVQVENTQKTDGNTLDLSARSIKGTKQPSNSDSNAVTRSLTSSSVGDSNSGEDDGAQGAPQPEVVDQSKRDVMEQRDSIGKNCSNRTSSDDSCSSSSAAKRLWQANANLERNVRWHKEKLLSKSGSVKSKSRHHKDDVTGASVTANNASARLSSLQHHPESQLLSSPSSDSNVIRKKPSRYESMEEQSSSEDSLLAGVEEKKKEASKNVNESSDDSGYRESNGSLPSREDTSSSDNEFPNDNGRRKRRKPLAPTCTVCLIRSDLTTIWCEVTSSIRTRLVEDEAAAEITPQATASGKSTSSKSERASSGVKESEVGSSDDAIPTKEIKELLLCLRPIRDGDKKVDESLRFTPPMDRVVDSGYETAALSADNDAGNMDPSAMCKHRPPKKRFPHLGSLNSSSSSALPSLGDSPLRPACASDAEKSVVESLILMSSEKK